MPNEAAVSLLRTIEQRLFTPYGLRDTPDSDRVSPAWLGPFVSAWLRVHHRSPEAQAAEKTGRVGAHGYLGSSPEMHTWLVVLGAGKGALGEVPLWNVAPTLAKWLGVAWAKPTDGEPVGVLVGK